MSSNPPSEPPSRTSTPNTSSAAQRFTSQAKTTEELLADQTIGLVALSDFRKRRADALEAKERDAQESVFALSRKKDTSSKDPSIPTPGTSDGERNVSTAGPKRKKKKPTGPSKLSFGDDDDDGENGAESSDQAVPKKKLVANATSHPPPKALTKAALMKEAAAREALRKEFLLIQSAVKEARISIPFVFYDGTNVQGGVCNVKKGDFIWVFLDMSRKVGAILAAGEKGVGEKGERAARREWAKIGVDDLMMVRGELIIPHHYDFYYFIVNQTLGPQKRVLFPYSANPPAPTAAAADGAEKLEGHQDDPKFTKVVDRRWYERNKHIYPASSWAEFDPAMDYQNVIKRDAGGNAFFFA